MGQTAGPHPQSCWSAGSVRSSRMGTAKGFQVLPLWLLLGAPGFVQTCYGKSVHRILCAV